MHKNIDNQPSPAAAIIDLGDAVVQTKGSVLQGNPDTATGQKFHIMGLSAD